MSAERSGIVSDLKPGQYDLQIHGGCGYSVGDSITYTVRPYWFVRLYRWLFRIKPNPARFVVTEIVTGERRMLE